MARSTCRPFPLSVTHVSSGPMAALAWRLSSRFALFTTATCQP